MNRNPLLRGLLAIAVMAAIGYLAKSSGLFSRLDASWIDAEVRGRGAYGEIVFVSLGALAVAVGVPRQVVSFLGGYAFGFLSGASMALVATCVGCTFTFGYARLLGRDLVQSRFPGRIRKLDAFLAGNPVAMSLLLRLLPVGNNMVSTLVAGVSRVPAAGFFTGSFLGFVPQTVIFALIGSGVEVASTLRIAIGVCLFVVSGLIGMRLVRKYREFAGSFDAGLEEEMQSGTAK